MAILGHLCGGGGIRPHTQAVKINKYKLMLPKKLLVLDKPCMVLHVTYTRAHLANFILAITPIILHADTSAHACCLGFMVTPRVLHDIYASLYTVYI